MQDKQQVRSHLSCWSTPGLKRLLNLLYKFSSHGRIMRCWVWRWLHVATQVNLSCCQVDWGEGAPGGGPRAHPTQGEGHKRMVTLVTCHVTPRCPCATWLSHAMQLNCRPLSPRGSVLSNLALLHSLDCRELIGPSLNTNSACSTLPFHPQHCPTHHQAVCIGPSPFALNLPQDAALIAMLMHAGSCGIDQRLSS